MEVTQCQCWSTDRSVSCLCKARHHAASAENKASAGKSCSGLQAQLLRQLVWTRSSCKRRFVGVTHSHSTEKSTVKTEGHTFYEVDGKGVKQYPSDGSAVGAQPSNGLRIQEDVVSFAKGFILPKGYPATVTDDYLEYQARTLPAHITGWIGKSLATSSLIHALGVGSVGPSATVATSAAIKWITKDGIGAFGRFLVGGRLGGVFDEDPRRWRMIAVGFATVGFALEIATTAFPSAFIVLAGLGNFSKAIGRGLSQPSFRIIQTHFAAANNVGDISAKEEVWEVTAQLLGLAGSVALLRAIESSGNPEAVLWIWVLIQIVHVYLRYASLKSLCFAELNQKRASLLVCAHVASQPIPGIKEANIAEPVFAGSSGVGPNIELGVGFAEAFGDGNNLESDLKRMAEIYGSEENWLVWRGGKGFALLSVQHTPTDLLRILYQGAWFHAKGVVDASNEEYAACLDAVSRNWCDFEAQIFEKGWDPAFQVYRIASEKRIGRTAKERAHH